MAAVLLAVSACLIGVWLHSTRVQEVHWLALHGERSAHVLEDGSSVLLASEAEVTVRYSKTERLVRLDHGQAYFQVAKGDGRRFRVVAGDSSVVATGTQFDVRLEDHREVVSLLEGRVEVYADSLALAEEGTTEGPAVRALRAGEQVTVRDGRISMPVRVNEQAIRAWQRGQLVAQGMPLADVLQEYNRYRRSPLHTADPSLAEIRIGGVFNLDDSDTLLSFLRSSLSIDSRQTPEGVELYRAAPPSRTETR
jgi:transmembrane sensor